MNATNQPACTCHRCGARYDVLSFSTHRTARVQPDVAGDPEAVMLAVIDCDCVSVARATLSIDLSTLQAALAAHRVAA